MVGTWRLAETFYKKTLSHNDNERGVLRRIVVHNNKNMKKKMTLFLDESGAVAVTFLIIFASLCGIGGLVLDYGNMVRVRSELQRTADAGALAGAMGLVPYNNPGANQYPNWIKGESEARTLISDAANKADNVQFDAAGGTVDHGWWWIKPASGDTQWQTARTFNSKLPQPAIRVTLSSDVTLYLAPLIGVTSPKTVSATAIAILPEANTINKLVPIGVKKDTVFNIGAGGILVIDVSDVGITVNSNKDVAGWYTMNSGDNFPSSVLDHPLTAGTDPQTTTVYMQPGSEVTLMNKLIKAGNTYTITVVADVIQKTDQPIVGFAAFHIDSVTGPKITGHFVNEYYDPNVVPTEGNATISAVGGTPKLVIQQ
jgi:hypothetical protein